MDYINAFWVGGLICALVQILLDKTKLLPGRVMVLLVCTGAVLGSVGIYNKLMDFAGAGASVPLLGFGNLLWKGVKKAIGEQGFIGIFPFRRINRKRGAGDSCRFQGRGVWPGRCGVLCG